jgi:hypothetical protein
MFPANGAFTPAIPAVALEGFDQIPQGAGIFRGATRPDKTGFNTAVVGVGNIHGGVSVIGLLVRYAANSMPNETGLIFRGDGGIYLLET